jgi:hypothetical protein
MRISSLFAYSMGVALAAAVIAGCSNGATDAFGPPQSRSAGLPAGVTSTSALLARTALAKITLSQHGKPATGPVMPVSTVTPGTPTPSPPPLLKGCPWCIHFSWPHGFPPCIECPIRGPSTLAVSDLTDNQAWLYSKTLTTLTGFSQPYGQCVDKEGDTWITNFGSNSVVEYARGGTEEINSLSTSGNSIGCSVSPNGDLAVANFSSASGYGNVQVFKNAAGAPTTYSNENDYDFWPPGYDDKGNLFVEAETANGVGVAELPAGGSSLQPVSLNQAIYYPGGVVWDGKYITLTDQDAGGNPSSPATTIYQMSETGSDGLSVVGSTSLQDSCNGSQVDVVQPFIAGKKNTPSNRKQAGLVIGGNLSCENELDVWAYPDGGQPLGIAKEAPVSPTGQSISIK